MSQKSFMFYLSWEEQLLELSSDEERWNFVHNLIKYHKNEELKFVSKLDKLMWMWVKIPVEINQQKWNERAENSRENGKKHTGKKLSKNDDVQQITQQVISEPEEPVKSKVLKDKSQKVNDNYEKENDNNKISNDNSEMSNDNNEKENSEFSYLEIMMDVIFENLPDWRIKLLKLGDDEFMEKYKSYFVSSIKNDNIIKKTYYYLVGKD
jgi:hypothetical protein